MNDKKDNKDKSHMAQDQYLPRVVEHAATFDDEVTHDLDKDSKDHKNS